MTLSDEHGLARFAQAAASYAALTAPAGPACGHPWSAATDVWIWSGTVVTTGYGPTHSDLG
ncbi:hypothetical protein [Streptomyces sp. NPDC093594]|uniref:hypothetical protein n=1 Tax=Streptomyces sp. NPDC093594 TaxID=3155305 RepID=UPI0034510C18